MDLSEFLKPTAAVAAIPFSFASDSIAAATSPITGLFNSSSTKKAATALPQKIAGWFFILAIILAIIYVVSLFIRIPGISGPTLPRTGASLWTGPETYSVDANINLSGNASGSITSIDSTRYTVSMEISIANPFANLTTNKHLFHRGSPILDASGRDIAALNLQTPQNLPIPVSTTGIMNPAIFIPSGLTNTIKVFIQDANHQEVATVLIDGVPVYRPFRLTVVVSDHIMDAYVDCKLVKSVFINGTMPSSTPTTAWAHIGTDFQGVVGAVRYYPGAFTARQVELLCKLAPTLKN